MKRIFLIFALLINLVAVSQNQTFTGVKTFANPPKFKNVLQNNANTKVLTVNSNDVLQWRDANTIAPTPTLQVVTNVGNTTTKPIIINVTTGGFGNAYTKRSELNETGVTTRSTNDLIESYNEFKYTASGISKSTFFNGNLNDYNYRFPNVSGDLVVDAPADDQNYVRNNNTWQVASTGPTPTLNDVLNSGAISTDTFIRLQNSAETSFLDIRNDGLLILKAVNSSPVTITSSPTDINIQSSTYISPDGGAVAKISNAANYNFAPPSNSANGYKGEIRAVGGYLYVCTTSNPTTGIGTWVRSAVETTW